MSHARFECSCWSAPWIRRSSSLATRTRLTSSSICCYWPSAPTYRPVSTLITVLSPRTTTVSGIFLIHRSGMGEISRSSASPRPPCDGTPSASVWPSPGQTPGPSCPYPSDRTPPDATMKHVDAQSAWSSPSKELFILFYIWENLMLQMCSSEAVFPLTLIFVSKRVSKFLSFLDSAKK